MEKSAKKSASAPGIPFKKGHDVRRGRGPRRGAANAGRPPDEFRAELAELASREETLNALGNILSNSDHPHFIHALKYCADRGYGKPLQDIAVDIQQRQVVIVAPPKLTQAEWVKRYGPMLQRRSGAVLDRLTSLRFCCAANVVTASEAREPDAYRDSSNRLLDGEPQGLLLELVVQSALESRE